MADSATLIEELESTLSHRSLTARAEALQHVTDLFVVAPEQYSDEIIGLFDEVFNRLIVDLEMTARAILASRLAPIRRAPPIIIRSLAFDDCIEVAGPVLTRSMQLDDAALVYNASVKGQPHLLAISRRQSLSDVVTEVLVIRGNRDVVLNVAGNLGAMFSDRGYGMLVKRCEYDDELAERVGSRPDIPRQHFLALLAQASDVVRQKLEKARGYPAEAIEQSVREAAAIIQQASAQASPEYHDACRLVDELRSAGTLSEADVATFARQGKFATAAVAIARLADMPVATVEQAMAQDRPDMVLMLAKVVRLSWTTTKALLRLCKGGRGIPQHDLDQWMARYERIDLSTAEQVLRFRHMRRRTDRIPEQ